MFSHKINNSNNFIIKDDYYIVPFGHRCTTAIACYYANIRKISLPFDWCNPALPKKIQKVLENNFDEFIPDVLNGVFDNKYNFNISHFNSNIEKGISDYIRRIDRFNSIINDSKKIYFIYINEDYLYNSKYREDKFNEETFNEMLELEKYMKDSYKNIDYNIAPKKLLNSCVASVCQPISTTAVISKALKIPTAFYDPLSRILHSDQALRGIPLLDSMELDNWFDNLRRNLV